MLGLCGCSALALPHTIGMGSRLWANDSLWSLAPQPKDLGGDPTQQGAEVVSAFKDSMYCWMIYQVGVEDDIVAYMYENKMGVFNCNGQAVIGLYDPSNSVIALEEPMCKYGGTVEEGCKVAKGGPAALPLIFDLSSLPVMDKSASAIPWVEPDKSTAHKSTADKSTALQRQPQSTIQLMAQGNVFSVHMDSTLAHGVAPLTVPSLTNPSAVAQQKRDAAEQKRDSLSRERARRLEEKKKAEDAAMFKASIVDEATGFLAHGVAPLTVPNTNVDVDRAAEERRDAMARVMDDEPSSDLRVAEGRWKKQAEDADAAREAEMARVANAQKEAKKLRETDAGVP